MDIDECGICQGAGSGRFWICCDTCRQWFHIRCLKMTRKHSEEVENYVCYHCIMTKSSPEEKRNESFSSLKTDMLRIEDSVKELRKGVEALHEHVTLMGVCAVKVVCVDKGIQCDYKKKKDNGTQSDNPEKGDKGVQCDDIEKEEKCTYCNLEKKENSVLELKGINGTKKKTSEGKISSSWSGNTSLAKLHSSSKASKLSLKKPAKPEAPSAYSIAMAQHDKMDKNDFKRKRL